MKGNHEDLFQDMIIRNRPLSHDLSNGTLKTLKQLTNGDYQTFTELRNNYDVRIDELISKMVNYYETPHYVFVHGWLPCAYAYNKNWRDPEEFNDDLWKDTARWMNGMEQAMEYDNYIPDKTVVCGHWHCSYGNGMYLKKWESFLKKRGIWDLMLEYPEISDPFKTDRIIAIDACTAWTKKCNCLKFTEEEL